MLFRILKRRREKLRQEMVEHKVSAYDAFHRGYLEAGGYDPDKECGDWITERILLKEENMFTGRIEYLLRCEGPYEVYKDITLKGAKEAYSIYKRFDMKKIGSWDKLADAPIGEVATWDCGHDIMQDDDYWDKKNKLRQ
jgi:hypothetical protein